MNRYLNYFSYLLVFFSGMALAALLIGVGFVVGRRASVPGTTPAPMSIGADQGSNAIVQAVKLVGPAVVTVDTAMPMLASGKLPLPEAVPQYREGKGTGVIFDAERGLMITNAHVVTDPQTGETAQRILVSTRDGQEFVGKLLGADRFSDIAVVKLPSSELPEAKIAPFEDAKQLAIGQWVIAIGNPYAQENTVTVGVVSAVGRTIAVPARGDSSAFSLTGMIQTDAAINPGNSGGPLCNLKGEVIGINTAIIPWATGLGFSIPISQAMKVAHQIVAKGHVEHPYIGVMLSTLDYAIRQKHSLVGIDGAFVQSVQDNSPAKRAGIFPNDVITKMDGKNVSGSEAVIELIGGKKVGEVIVVTVRRQGKTKQLQLKIGDRPQETVVEN